MNNNEKNSIDNKFLKSPTVQRAMHAIKAEKEAKELIKKGQCPFHVEEYYDSNLDDGDFLVCEIEEDGLNRTRFVTFSQLYDYLQHNQPDVLEDYDDSILDYVQDNLGTSELTHMAYLCYVTDKARREYDNGALTEKEYRELYYNITDAPEVALPEPIEEDINQSIDSLFDTHAEVREVLFGDEEPKDIKTTATEYPNKPDFGYQDTPILKRTF